MDPRFKLKSNWNESDSDLILWLDTFHFNKHEVLIDELRLGDKITFRGYIRNLKVKQGQAIKSND